MGINLSVVMLLMGAGIAQDVAECGKIRILGLYMQDTTVSYNGCLGPGMPFATEVSDFMDKAGSVYPGSMFGVYSFQDRLYDLDPYMHTTAQTNDYIMITPLVDIPTAKSHVSEIVPGGGGGRNSGAFDVMYHLIVNNSDSGIDSVTPLADTYDAKVLYVFTDGIPEYIEATQEECIKSPGGSGFPCFESCGGNAKHKCCDSGSGKWSPVTSLIDYGTAWNSTAECPMDLTTLGKLINDNDWYVAYVAACDMPVKGCYPWTDQVSRMGIESRFSIYSVEYSYAGLSEALVDITSKIMCSAVPSNNPAGLPTGGATNPPTVAPSTAGPTTAPSTGGSPTGGLTSEGSATGGPTTGGLTSEGPTTGGKTGEGGPTTTTTTTKKPFPIGLVCGCAAGALVAIAGGTVAANRLTGWPPMPEFEFEGDEGEGHEEVERETQVAVGEADFA